MQPPNQTINPEQNINYEENVYAQKEKDVAESPESLFFENLAEKLNEDDLKRIATEVVEGYETDLESISELKEMRDRYNKLFDLNHEEKNFPWENSASIKLPTLTKACIQFASRSGINSESGSEIAKIDPVSSDEESFLRAKNVSAYFNYKLKYSKPNHYLSHRQTRMQLARDGYAFRKVYWDSINKSVVSEHILPEDFIINYWSTSLETCYRYTHVLKLNENQIKIKMAQGVYRQADVSTFQNKETDTETAESKSRVGQNVPDDDFTSFKDILECHTYIHLEDGDDLRIPVIVTVEKNSQEVLRIVRRSHPETGKPLHYFSNYTFIPNDKSIYGYGFGHLLFNLVSTMNSSTNMLMNSGTLSTTVTGIVSKHAGLKGAKTMKMGEFIEAEGRVDDLDKHFKQLSFPAPSGVLLNLLQYLGNLTDQLTTVTEIMSGGQPRSDTTATAATIAQSEAIKLFTDIQKSYHLSLGEEFQNMKNLYSIFLDETQTVDVLGMTPFTITRDDFKTNLTIQLVADPNVLNRRENIQRAEYILNLIKQDRFLSQSPQAILLGTENLLQQMGTNPKDIDKLKAIYNESIQMMQMQQQQALQMQQQQTLNQDMAKMQDEQRQNLEKDLAVVEQNEAKEVNNNE